MKNLFHLKKSKLLLLTLLALIVGGSPAWADELTVNDGTGKNQYLPVFGNYVDTPNTISEFIIPSDRLADIDGATISGMTFYLQTPVDGAWGAAEFEVYMKEVEATEYTSTTANTEGSNTTVYSGSLDGSQSTMDVVFSNNYTYNGGNLLIGFKVTTSGSWKGTYFYGEELSWGTNNAFHYATSSQSGKDSFLPKVTFKYATAAGVLSKPKNVTASNIIANSATISWTAGGSETSWELSYSTSADEPAEEGSYTSVNTTPSYNLTGLTAETPYYVYVRAIDGDNHSKWSAVCTFTPTNSKTTTVNDGTLTNAYVPFYGSYADTQGTMSQFIVPAASLTEVQGRQITKLTFYDKSSSLNFGTAQFKVFMKETTATTFESSTFDWTDMEEVADANVSVTDGLMVIELEAPFDYTDGNLMIGFNLSTTGSWKSTNWYGVSSSSSAIYAYSSTKSIASFLPKMTITSLPQSSAPKMKVEAESSYDFGFLTAASEEAAKTASFTVKNVGNVALTDANIAYSGDAAISLSNTGTLASIDAKSSTDITITVNTETPGSYAGTITITGTGSDDVTIPVKAIVRNTDKLFVDFDATNPKPSAWTLGDGWSVNANGYATIGSTAAAITTSEILSAGETVTLRYRGNNASATLAVSYCATVDGKYTACTETVSSISTEAWQTATFTIPAEGKFVKITGQYLDLDAVYGLQAPAVPAMALSATEHAFGLVSDAEAQAFTFTITNEGGAALNGLSVTCDNAAFVITDAEGNALPTTIAAGNSITVKVKMNAAGSQNGTITVSGTGVENQTVTVSGYMLDNTKILETFTSLPSRWSNTGWSFTSNVASVGSTARKLTTPKIIVAENEVLAINAMLGWSSGYFKLEGSTDNGETWEAFDAKTYNYSNGGLNTTSYVLVTIDDIPAGTYIFRITGEDVKLNAFNGFTYAPDPKLSIYSNEACTSEQASPAAKNFSFITEAQSHTYYIKNTGNGQIDLSIAQADGFTAAVADAALTESESTALTITMANTPEGLHNGTIVVTAKNHDTEEVLGTFEVAVNGAVAGSKNDINFASLSELPAGWESTNSKWTVTENSYVGISGTADDLISQAYTVSEGETLLIEANGNSSWNTPTLTYSYKAGDAEWTEATTIEGVAYADWKIFAITGIPTGQAKVKFNGTYTNIRRIYGFEAAAVPYMVFAADGTTKNFGMVTAATTSDAYTITNSGAGVLNNLSVTCDNANFEIAVTDNVTSIAANGGTATFTVKLKTDVQGSQSGTVTIAGTGVESKTLTVKGYVADGTKIFETFAAAPANWEISGWTFDDGVAYSSSSSNTLVSPKITVAEGQKLAISAKLQYSNTYYYVTVEGSTDNGSTWTYSKKLSNDVLNKDSYTVIEIDDIPTTVNKIRLIGYYVYVNGLNGFTYNANDPKLGVFSDEACETAIAETTVTNAWGFVNEAQTATYYIKNTGTGTMSLTKTDAPAGFTVTLGATSLGAGEKTTLTVAMDETKGYRAGNVVLTAKDDSEASLGTFTVTSSAVLVDPTKTDVNFTTLSDFPAGWESTNWTVTENTKATVGFSTGTLTTGAYQVVEGDQMVVVAKKQYSSGTLSYQYSTNGTDWSEAVDITPSSTTNWELKVISDISAAEEVFIKFNGYYMDIQRIYGYTAVAKPVMSLDKSGDYDFGMQTAASDPYVITVTNNGTAEMTGLAAVLTKGEESDYTVAVSKTTLAVNEEATITITQKYDASKGLASLSDVLTISADDLASKTINLSGQTRDASKWYVDFADGTIPASFIEKGSWTAASQYAYTNSTSSLVSQPVTLAAGEKIQFDARMPYSGATLKTRYSTNGGITWSDYASVELTSEYATKYIDLGNTESVTALIEFQGYYYAYLTNIYGGTLNNEAPAISVKKGEDKVETGVTEAFGAILTETPATYTIKNIGNGTLTITSPVTVTGVATATVDQTSLANGESATLTITLPVAAPYGAKEGAVTVTTSLGDFVINYTATTMNPNALNIDFADNSKPASWYFGGYWEVSNEQAQNTASGAADLISQKLTVAGTDDALTFQVAKTGSSAATFAVYTSTDRTNWTAVDLGDLTLTTDYQDVTVKNLAAGDYYLKITGTRVKVDNFIGWTKVTGIEHDLYVTATSFPTTAQDAEAAVEITATVTSLIADETGVYAKLFINGEEAVTATAADVALNNTKTFTMAYTMPTTPGTYNAQVKVYYSGGTEAFATATKALKVYMSLNQNTDPGTLAKGTFDIKVSRNFAEGWNTVCLPFAVANVEDVFGTGAKVYDFTGYADGALQFTKVTATTAGKPYIVYVASAIDETAYTAQNVEVGDANKTAANTAFNGATFQGTYAPMEAGTMTGKYGVTAAGKIAKGGASASMKGFRAYFELPDGASIRLAFFDGNDEPTIIDAVELDKVDDGSRAYNLNGQRVETLKKGNLYIINGKKVIRK